MKQFILITFLFIFSTTAFGQIYLKPQYAKKSNTEITLEKITITDDYTIVEITHKNPFDDGGWANIYRQTFIRNDKGKKYRLLKAKGIPISPFEHHYRKKGEILRFKLYFPSINPAAKYIDIIEIENEQKAFNFYKVKLVPIA